MSVVLVDQPWVVAGRRIAVAPATLDIAWVPAVRAAREASGASRHAPLVVGGRSAGARVACRTSADVRPASLLLLAVPLVPPAARRDADRYAAALAVRRAELRGPLDAGVPIVVAQGERDAFGSARELRAALGRPTAVAVEVVAVVGADHSLRTARGGAGPGPVLLMAALRAIALAGGE